MPRNDDIRVTAIAGPYFTRFSKNSVGWRCYIRRSDGRRSAVRFDVEAEAQKFVEEIKAKISGLDPRKTVEMALVDYRRFLQDKGNKKRSIDTTMIRLNEWLKPVSKKYMTAVKAADVSRLYQVRVEGVKADTHRNELSEIKTFFRWAVKQNLIEKNPAEGIEPVGRRSHGKDQLRIDELKKWMRTAMKLAPLEPGAVAALMAVMLGLRATEIVERVVRDLDDEGRILWITSSKTQRGIRRLYVPRNLRTLLLKLVAGRQADGWLLGAHHDRQYPNSWVKKICGLADVPVVTAHGMRGLHATLAMEAGGSPELVAKALGHSKVKTTYKHYATPESREQGRQKRFLSVVRED